MKVFISWSGDHSRKVAELLKSWLQDVNQHVKPWLSNEDISKGDIWFAELRAQLAEIDFGILCVTADNASAPWILFEAGALSKGLSRNRVCPLVIDFDPGALRGPLEQFNAARPTKPHMLKLVQDINEQGGTLVPGDVLLKSFNRCWPEFEEQFQTIEKEAGEQPEAPTLTQLEMTAEILQTVRALHKASQKPRNTGKLGDLPAINPAAGSEHPVFTFLPNDDGTLDIYKKAFIGPNLYRQVLDSMEHLRAIEKSSPYEDIKKPKPAAPDDPLGDNDIHNSPAAPK